MATIKKLCVSLSLGLIGLASFGAHAANSLESRQTLYVQQSLISDSGQYRFTFEADGNLVLRNAGGAKLWNSGTAGKNGQRLVLQADGNLVLLSNTGAVVWSSKTNGMKGRQLRLLDDGNLVLNTASQTPVWASHTVQPASASDTTKPVITLAGSSSISVSQGSAFVDTSAMASDDRDGDLSAKIVVSGGVNTALPGSYALSYNVKDAAGNAATAVTRFVTVQGAATLVAGSLPAGQSLTTNQSLLSLNGGYKLILQTDGNLVLYNASNAVRWSSGTTGKGGVRLSMQGDGNLVLYTAANAPVWVSNTAGKGGTRLVLSDLGNLAILNASGVAVWSTNTGSVPVPGACGTDCFSIGVMPDTQILVEYDGYHADGPARANAMAQFFVDKRAAINLKFVIALGDLVENSTDLEFKRIRTTYNILKNAGIPYSPLQGNHDTRSKLNQYFPVSEFNGKSNWCGNQNGIENACFTFSSHGLDFVIVSNEWDAYTAPRDWANSKFAQYRNRRGIFVAHDISPGHKRVEEIVRKNDNVFMSVSGHRCVREEYWTSRSPTNKVQHNLTTDYQCDSDGGPTVRYYTFWPKLNKVCAWTYNAWSKKYETDSNSQFCFAYQMTN